MNLYLIQHARAVSKEEDPDRPLSGQGRIDIDKVARFVARNGDILVRQINHSGKTRARQTAEILAQALDPTEGISDIPDLAPLDDPSVWVSYLADTTRNLMLVGHLPHLGRLAALLVCQDDSKQVVDFQMGSMVCLGRDDAGNWSFRWIITPDMVR